MITENLSTLKIHNLTKEQYERELAAGRIDENALYLTPYEEADLSEYATQEYVDEGLATKQPVGDYALKSEIPTDYLTEIPSEYVTETELNAKGYLTSYTETDPTVPAWAKAATKPTYTASEVGALSANTVIPTVPTNVSAFINDAGYLTKHQSLDGLATEDYVDDKIAAIPTPDVSGQISTHNTSTSSHNDIRLLIEGLATRLNALADSDDTTLDQMSEVVAYIKSNKSLIDSITTSKVNVADIINDLTTNVDNKPLSAAQGVVIKTLIDALQSELDSHTHAIADVSGLQSALDGKAASSHGTHVTYSTTAPVMDGTASAGSASTVARSDHKHPTDTSRAAKADFDSHAADTTKHVTSTERTNWNAAKTHADSAHAPSNAEKNQNAFSNIVVGSTTIAADTATDSLTLVGSNVTLTPDATNDKVTIGITKANVTSALGYTPPTTNTTYSVVSTSADGLAPKRDGSTTKFLRGDGTWAVPPDTNTVYTHPTYTAKSSGLYKVTVDSTGHVSNTTAVAKSDITALGIPAQDTTYNAATASTAGLMSAADKAKLDGIATGADALPTVTTSNNGQFLRVVNGVWTAASIPNAEEASF